MGGGRRGSDRARRRHVRRKKGMRDVIGRRDWATCAFVGNIPSDSDGSCRYWVDILLRRARGDY